MNTKTILAGVSLCALAITGCVTVESTRAKLASSNPEEVKKAKETIFLIVTTGEDETHFLKFDATEQIEYVKLVSDTDLLLRLLDRVWRDEVRAAVVARLNLSEPGLAMKILMKHRGAFRVDGFADKVIGQLTAAELEEAYKSKFDFDEKLRNRVVVALIAKTQKPSTLMSLYKDTYLKYETRIMAFCRIADVNGKLAYEEDLEYKLEKLLFDMQIFSKPEVRTKLLTKFSDETAVKFLERVIRKRTVGEWFDDAVFLTVRIKDSSAAAKIVSSMLRDFARYEDVSGVDTKRRDTLSKFLKGLPWLDDSMMKFFICGDETSWRFFIDSIPENMAYDILVEGKAKSKEFERKLVEVLPIARIDMKVYKGVHFDETRKAVMAKMPPELQKAVAEEEEKAFRAICEKAKAAAKETFELDGFYLGMTFDDMKIVFGHHFPKFEIKEAIDGEGKNANYVIYVPGQSSPFCYASGAEKKVWRFNFGKKLLKKWYPFDVQTPAEWAVAYERATKVDMRFKLIEKDTTVYEPMDMSTSYRVWFHQESYQYKNNTKEFRLTYFGEQKDFTCEGGIGGAIIKEMAAPRFRYVRGDPGSLRVQIERD